MKILDFTAAKFFLAGLRTTEPAARVGTIAFMSPEHITGETSDARLDQYSLGLCLYCMLRGRHPFERHMPNQFALMKAQAEEVPEPLEQAVGLPGWIDDLLAPALAKDLAHRYPTMADFARAIHEAMRRVAREEREGRVFFDVPLGEPPIDVEANDGARTSHAVYVPPELAVRQTTAPVMPEERVSVAPEALADAPVAAEDEPGSEPRRARAATAPRRCRSRPAGPTPRKPAHAHRTTTAPVPPMMTTTPMRRAVRPWRWIAPAGGSRSSRLGALGWRVRSRPATPPPATLVARPPSRPRRRLRQLPAPSVAPAPPR